MTLSRYTWHSVWFWRIAVLLILLTVWQWGFSLQPKLPWLVPSFIDPYFISTPTGVLDKLSHMACMKDEEGQLLLGRAGAVAACFSATDNNLLAAISATLRNTFWGFALGVSTGFVVGLLLGRSPFWASVFDPYIVGFNSVPRIALVPLIVLIFGLGDASKILTAWLIVFFVVFFNTFGGARQVQRDLVHVARVLGATNWQVMTRTVIPSTLEWVFASLVPSVSFALIGVIVGEFIGSERGLGRLIIEAQGRGDAAAMMATLSVLVLIGVMLSGLIHQVQEYLLRWR
ncbi:ABC transporter permease [Janthinobacterium lividum]